MDKLWSILDDLVWALVVLAWWDQRALRAPLRHHHLTLEVDSSLAQLLETLPLQQFPNLLLVEVITAADKLPLIRIQIVVEASMRRLVVMAEGREECHA